jgi:hypothetical protein
MQEQYNARYLVIQNMINHNIYSLEEPLEKWNGKFQ